MDIVHLLETYDSGELNDLTQIASACFHIWKDFVDVKERDGASRYHHRRRLTGSRETQ